MTGARLVYVRPEEQEELIPAAEVALITLLEVVLGPLWVWLALSERPSTTTLVGGAVVVSAVVLQAGGDAVRS